MLPKSLPRLLNSLNSPISRPRGIGWRKERDVLHLKPREGETGWKRYDAYLWFPEQYQDFVCRFDFKLGEGGNSGFYFRISDQSDATLHGFEIQLKDDYGKEEMGPHDVGGVIKTSGPKVNAVKPAGEWNEMIVRLKGSKLMVKLNDQTVQQVNLEKARPADKPLAKKAGSQFRTTARSSGSEKSASENSEYVVVISFFESIN